ncbi:hypothetical protein ACHAXS_013285 [Conticribra weissflogii]
MTPLLPLRNIILAILSLTTASTAALSIRLCNANNNNNTKRKHAIVVGAGPVGLAAALVLSTRHSYDVTLLESSPRSASQSNYDPTKAFLYLVNARGQTLTRMFPAVQAKLEERGVVSRSFADAKIVVVPSDPGEEIPKERENVRGATTTKAAAAASEKAASPGYWIPRHEMVRLMVECVEERTRCGDGDGKGDGGKIRFLLGKECTSVAPAPLDGDSLGGGVLVTARDVNDDDDDDNHDDNENNTNDNGDNHNNHGEVQTFRASLVIGADGMNSKVRECLSTATTTNTQWAYASPKPKAFRLKKYTSPASHLRIKVLQFPPRFRIPDARGKPPVQTSSDRIYAIRSAFAGPRNYLSLGLLPMKDNDAVRPTNIITRPDHEIWTIRDGDSMRSYFQRAFPRFDFSSSSSSDDPLISKDEWERFAKAEGTRFPPCQHSPGLAVWTDDGNAGVALVGDAAHAFSPDIGQGINAGLMDVVCLDRALSGVDVETGKAAILRTSDAPSEEDGTMTTPMTMTTPTLSTALRRYQTQHSPEIASLIRLARFGAPYQYRQPHRIDRIRAKLWTMNLALRLILNKLTFGLVQPQCMLLAQNGDLTYSQVMRRADLTTLGLKSVALTLLALFVKKTFGFGILTVLA